MTREHNNASERIAELRRSDTHSSQDHAKTSKSDSCITTDATIGDDGTANVRHAPNSREDTDSTAPSEVNIPTDQNDEPTQDETFPRGGEYNLYLTLS